MTVRKKSQSKTRMQGKTSYRARYVELAHQGSGLRPCSAGGSPALVVFAHATPASSGTIWRAGSAVSLALSSW